LTIKKVFKIVKKKFHSSEGIWLRITITLLGWIYKSEQSAGGLKIILIYLILSFCIVYQPAMKTPGCDV
jgi:hypothetical protein